MLPPVQPMSSPPPTLNLEVELEEMLKTHMDQKLPTPKIEWSPIRGVSVHWRLPNCMRFLTVHCSSDLAKSRYCSIHLNSSESLQGQLDLSCAEGWATLNELLHDLWARPGGGPFFRGPSKFT